MLTLLIGGLAGVLLYVTIGNGETGPAVLCVAVVLFLRACAKQERKSWQAYRNFRDYWADGGPDRKR